MALRSVDGPGYATELYLNMLDQMATQVSEADSPELTKEWRDVYLPGAFTLAAAYERAEGYTIDSEAEFRAVHALGVVRGKLVAARATMTMRLGKDLRLISAWEPKLTNPAIEVVRNYPPLPAFAQLRELAVEVAQQDESLSRLSKVTVQALVDYKG